MSNGLIKYSAVTAKVRAMHGKNLTAAQWEKLGQAKSLRAVWDVLRACPAWAEVGEDARCALDGDALIHALSRQLERDCKNLCRYLDKGDGESLRAFCRYQSGRQTMTPEQYQRWWRDGGGKFAGSRAVVGAEADALNLVYILRLRRFPGSVDRAEELLIPIRDGLNDRLIRQLLHAGDDEAALAILRKTRWGGAFTSLAPGDLEKEYQMYMERFCRHIIASAPAGLAVVQAYLPLKDMERRRLTRLAGAVSRGLDPKPAV